MPPAMELQSLNHWTGREVPSLASSYFHVLYSLSLEEEMAFLLENSMDRGARRATVHGVARSQTRLSDYH